MPKIREEGYLFISIGFFSSTLLQIGWQLRLPELGALSPMYVFLFIILFDIVVVAIASVGVHHLVTISIITTTLDWQQLGIEPVVYAMTILLAWALCSMTSPFAPAIIITSRITQRSPFQIGIIENGLFSFFVLLGGAIYLTIINSFFN